MKTWQFVCTIITIFITVGSSSLLLAFNQGKMTEKVENNIIKSTINTATIEKNTNAITDLKIEVVKLTNELKLVNK